MTRGRSPEPLLLPEPFVPLGDVVEVVLNVARRATLLVPRTGTHGTAHQAQKHQEQHHDEQPARRQGTGSGWCNRIRSGWSPW